MWRLTAQIGQFPGQGDVVAEVVFAIARQGQESEIAQHALVADEAPWIEANFPETDLTWVHPGQRAEVRIDTYPGRVWHGEVQSLSPATGAEFSLIPAQNATGNWVKVTQRLPLRIRLDAQPDLPRLRAGLSAIVRIDTGHRRTLFGFSAD